VIKEIIKRFIEDMEEMKIIYVREKTLKRLRRR